MSSCPLIKRFLITYDQVARTLTFLELKDENDPDEVIAGMPALLERDGDVISTKGDSLLVFPNVNPGYYYLSFRHRNHIDVITKYPYIFSNKNIPFIDFTDEKTELAGLHPTVLLNETRALWAGDFSNDEKTIFQGPGNDITDLTFHIIKDSLNTEFLPNYISIDYNLNDYNLDGATIFQGPNNDRAPVLLHSVISYPENTSSFANFVLTTEEPLRSTLLCISQPNLPHCDYDNDGILNKEDPDDDNDGVVDGNDIAPYDDSGYFGVVVPLKSV